MTYLLCPKAGECPQGRGPDPGRRGAPLAKDFSPSSSGTIVAWTPPEWVCNCFPQTELGQVEISLRDLIAVAQSHLDTVTEADMTARSAVLHIAHMLVTMQGPDGLWPERLDLRTGQELTQLRSAEPMALFRRLNAMLDSTEFDPACRWAEAGIKTAAVELSR